MRKSQKFIMVFTALITLAGIYHSTANACTTFGCKAEFEESFLDRDTQYFDLTQNTPTAIFNFNLVAPGGKAVLYNSNGSINKQYSPSPDVTKFNPLKSGIKSAELEIKFSDMDLFADFADINAGTTDVNVAGSTDIYYGDLDLGAVRKIRGCKKFDYIRQYDVMSFDLIELGFGQALKDGKFVTMVLDPSIFGNNFRIEWASLEVETTCLPPTPPTNPVPEPSTVMLLGAGLIGAGLLRRRMKK